MPTPTWREIEMVKALADGVALKNLHERIHCAKGYANDLLATTRKRFRCGNTISLVALFLRNKFID